jgi:predicted O-linked N-acetylglucosamine transferase (SPINDLY family)
MTELCFIEKSSAVAMVVLRRVETKPSLTPENEPRPGAFFRQTELGRVDLTNSLGSDKEFSVTGASLFEKAVACHRAGEFERARELYRRVLDQAPQHDDALFLLSVLALQSGQLEEAAGLLERAIGVAPDNALYFSNLGDVYRSLGRRSEAVGVLLMAIVRKPDFAEAVYNLALTFEEQGDLAAAAACYERARELKPGLSQATDRLAKLAAKRESSASSASAATALAALGETLRLGGRPNDAAAWYRVALSLAPRMANAELALGAIHAEAGRFDEAIDHFRRALELDEKLYQARHFLAAALGESGLVDESQATFRQAVALNPDDLDAHSALLFNMPFWPGVTASDILAEARSWNARHAHAIAAQALPPKNDRSPDRRLRIGYVSADFHTHVQSLFTIPLLKNHDHAHFEIVCYSSVAKPDGLTERIRGHSDVFREVAALDDAALAEVIRRDEVDILVDLTMHMTDRRLLVFARRPAPVQLCWLAYPGTTGLETTDYRLSDPFLDPPESNTDVYTERTIRLPDSFWCYDPLTDTPDVSALPAIASGRITFGCLNNFRKVNEGVLRLWTKVLAAVPKSRLLLMAPPGRPRERVRAIFEEGRVERDRIELVDRSGRLDYLAKYRDIDICLDTFPYNGHTTSLDALWMGVPTVTLCGETVVGRAGVSQAMNVGLPELIATTEDELVRVASSLAGDLEHLSELRRTLRERMKQSPLMDGARFARGVEAVYRDIWRRFCEKA